MFANKIYVFYHLFFVVSRSRFAQCFRVHRKSLDVTIIITNYRISCRSNCKELCLVSNLFSLFCFSVFVVDKLFVLGRTRDVFIWSPVRIFVITELFSFNCFYFVKVLQLVKYHNFWLVYAVLKHNWHDTVVCWQNRVGFLSFVGYTSVCGNGSLIWMFFLMDCFSFWDAIF